MKRAYVDTPEGQIHYQTEGSGEPLLLLHQIGLSSNQYYKAVPILANHYRVLAMDTIGCGNSDLPPLGYKTEDYARNTFHFLDALNIEKISIVGTRFGGSMAVEMAASQPERVDKLILTNLSNLEPEEREATGKLPRYDVMEIKEDGSHLLKLWEGRGPHGSFGGPKLTHCFVFEYLRCGLGLRAEDGHRALYFYDIQDRLPLIQSPTLLMYGPEYQFSHFERRELTQSLIPRCKIKIIEGARFIVMYEKPDEYCQVVLEFLENPEI